MCERGENEVFYTPLGWAEFKEKEPRGRRPRERRPRERRVHDESDKEK